jgi:hypothetical protein
MLKLILRNDLTESNYDLVGGLSRDREDVDVHFNVSVAVRILSRSNSPVSRDEQTSARVLIGRSAPMFFKLVILNFFRGRISGTAGSMKRLLLGGAEKVMAGLIFGWVFMYVSATAELTESRAVATSG